MGDAISEDTASALQVILDTALNESKSEKDKIVNDLIKQLNERKNEVDALNDKVNELTESLKTAEAEHQEEINDLNESIDDLKTSYDIETYGDIYLNEFLKNIFNTDEDIIC